MQVVADTSALVTLGTVCEMEPNPLDHLLASHAVLIPERVLAELRDTAAFEDASGAAANAVLDRREAFDVRSIDLDETFPLDEGENAAVTLANEADATQCLCDEFGKLALVHASLADTRLVTSPTLLIALVRNDVLAPDETRAMLDSMATARSWSGNSYVARARDVLDRE